MARKWMVNEMVRNLVIRSPVNVKNWSEMAVKWSKWSEMARKRSEMDIKL